MSIVLRRYLMRRWAGLVSVGIIGVIVIVYAITAATGGDSTPPPSGTTTSEATPTASTRCISVPKSRVDNIAEGLTVSGGGTLRNAWAVRSRDFERVYFVSAEIDGPGMEGDGEIGTWATNRLDETGLTYAVSGIAKEFSDWGAAGSPDFSMSDDGARESQECVRSR